MREENAKRYGRLYAQLSDLDYRICIYCGDPASGFDHVPPLSLAPYLDPIDTNFILYPACKQCNIELSTSVQPNIEERLQHLLDHSINKVNTIPQHPTTARDIARYDKRQFFERRITWLTTILDHFAQSAETRSPRTVRRKSTARRPAAGGSTSATTADGCGHRKGQKYCAVCQVRRRRRDNPPGF